jgi:hypothetical protein
MITARIKVGRIARVFRYADDDEKAMQVQLARLCVLYHDLMLEYAAANEDAIPLLDKSGPDSRRFYFVRRTLGTLAELRGAIAALEKNDAFLARKAGWEKGAQDQWNAAVAFFPQNHRFLKDWRNDVGGHFHDRAAEFAIDNIGSDTVGPIELYRRGISGDVRMKFAYELVAVAMVRLRNVNAQTIEQFATDAFTFLLQAVRHCVNPVKIVTMNELFDNFG